MMKYSTIRLLAILLALLTLCVGLASCSKAGDYDTENDVLFEDMGAAEKSTTVPTAGNGMNALDKTTAGTVPESSDRKIIKNFNIDAETLEFDQATAALNALIAEYGGYVERASVRDNNSLGSQKRYARSASYTVRVPAEKAEAFTGALGGHFNVTSQSSSVRDISETYYSVEARLAELIVERDSLEDILALPETEKDYDLWLTVHQRWTEIKQEIAVHQGTLNRYDNQVDYSTVYLSVNEVINYTVRSESNGFFARLGVAFREGWNGFLMGLQNFVIWFAEALPTLILIAVLLVVLILILRRIIRRRKAKKAAKQAEKLEEAAAKQDDQK